MRKAWYLPSKVMTPILKKKSSSLGNTRNTPPSSHRMRTENRTNQLTSGMPFGRRNDGLPDSLKKDEQFCLNHNLDTCTSTHGQRGDSSPLGIKKSPPTLKPIIDYLQRKFWISHPLPELKNQLKHF